MENRNLLNLLQQIKTRLQQQAPHVIPLLCIVLVAAVARVLPHPPNIAPVTGLALLSGAVIGKRWMYTLPLAAMLLSDLFIGFHGTIPYVYGSFVLITLLGSRFLRNTSIHGITAHITPVQLAGVSFVSSVLFFIITNFGVWISSEMYEKTLDGLLQCYTMAIPFFRNTITGDLIYTFGFFYGYRYVTQFAPQKALQKG